MHSHSSLRTVAWLSFVAGLSATGLLASAPARADIYRWVDEHGTVTYSASKPAGQSADLVNVKVTAPSPEAIKKLGQTVEAADEAKQERLKQETELAQQSKLAAIKTDNCTRARRNFEQLQSAIRIYHTNAAGEHTRIGEDERQADIKRMQDAIDQNCS